MVMQSVLYNSPRKIMLSLACLPLLASGAAYGEDRLPPLNLKGVYECSFSDVVIGEMGVEITQTPDHYSETSDIVSTGILKMFVNHSSHTTVEGSGSNFTYPAIDYDTHYQTKKKKKTAMLKYRGGVLTEENVTPPDNRATRPEVPMNLKQSASDPLSLIIRMRQGLFEALHSAPSPLEGEGRGGGGSSDNALNKRPPHPNPPPQGVRGFSLNIYDGRRLTEVDFTVIGPKTINYQGADTPVTMVDVRRKFLAGFTQSELSDWNPNEPPLHVYFSNDARLMPLRLELTLWMGTLAATLVKECGAGESCLLGITE